MDCLPTNICLISLRCGFGIPENGTGAGGGCQEGSGHVGVDPNTVHDEETPYTNMGGNKEGAEPSPLTNEEKEELKAKVAKSAYRAVGTCASQCFFIVIMCVLIGKIEGAGYSFLVIISPFLAAGGVLLCCLACTIFCISEVDENTGMAEFDTAVNQAAASGYGATEVSTGDNNYGQEGYSPPAQAGQQGDVSGDGDATVESNASSSKPKSPPSATWHPEVGEIWKNASVVEGEKIAANEGEQSAKEVGGIQPTTVEENPSIPSVSSSQYDLD